VPRLSIPKISSPYLRSSFVVEFVVSLVAGISAIFWGFAFTSEYNALDSRMMFRNWFLEEKKEKGTVKEGVLTETIAANSVTVVYLPTGLLLDLRNKSGSRETETTPRDYLAKLVTRISRGKPAVIGLDYNFDTADRAQNDNLLISAIRKARAGGIKIVGGYKLLPAPVSSSREDSSSIKKIKTATQEKYSREFDAVGNFNLWREKMNVDGEKKEIVRFTLAEISGLKDSSFSYQLYKSYLHARGTISRPEEEALPSEDLHKIRYINFRKKYIEQDFNLCSPEVFMNLPEELSENLLEGYFKDKIVIVGNAEQGKDYHFTPTNKDEGAYGIFIHAAIVSNYIQNDFIKQTSSGVNLLLIILLGCLALIISWRFPLLYIVLINGSIFLTYVLCAYTLYSIFLLWLPVISVFTVIFFTSLITIIVRIGFSEKDNIDADVRLREFMPEAILSSLKESRNNSVFYPVKGHVIVIAGWSKNLPLSEKFEFTSVISFLDDYYNSIREIIFRSGGCFNRLPQNGFMGFWPLDFYNDTSEDVLMNRALESAQGIRYHLESLNLKAERIFHGTEKIYMDIAIVEDEAFIGSFTNEQEQVYSLLSPVISEVLQIPWSFSGDNDNSILFFEKTAGQIKKKHTIRKMSKKISDKDVYEII